jgi:hypothetical protein
MATVEGVLLMTTRRAFLTGSATLLCSAQIPTLAPGFANVVGSVLAANAPHSGTPAAPSDSLVEFISVQTHLNWRGTVWDQSAWRPLLGDLGVRYTRSVLGTKMARDHLLALHSGYGIRASATFNAVNEDGSFKSKRTLSVLHFLKNEIGAEKVYAVEGPNEYTHRYKFGQWADRLREYQALLYNTVKSDTELQALDVLAPTIWKRIVEDYEQIASLGAYADYGNLHLYTGGRKPSLFNRNGSDEPIDLAIRDAQIVVPGNPVYITETGFNIADGVSPSKWKVTTDVAAKYTLRNLMELFLRRDVVKRVNIYSLIDDEHRDQHYGLLSADLTPRPAYFALRNMIQLVSDPGPEFVTASLPHEIVTDDPNVRSVLLQKRDGRFLLLLWQDAESYDRTAATAREIQPSRVQVDFGRSVASVAIYTPTMSASMQHELKTVTSATLDIPDHLVVAELSI